MSKCPFPFDCYEDCPFGIHNEVEKTFVCNLYGKFDELGHPIAVPSKEGNK